MMRPTILAMGLAVSIAFVGLSTGAKAQRATPEGAKTELQGLQEDAIRLHATFMTLQQVLGRNPALQEKIGAAIYRAAHVWGADYAAAVDRAKALGVAPPKSLERWSKVIRQDELKLGYRLMFEARNARERRKDQERSWEELLRRTPDQLLRDVPKPPPRDDYYPDAVPPDLPWPHDTPRNPRIEEMKTLLNLLAGLPGGLCAGSVRGAEARKLDPDPAVVAAMLRECIGGNGSGSRN